jgi:hypothetical protein
VPRLGTKFHNIYSSCMTEMRYVHPSQLPRGDVLFLVRLSLLLSLPTGWKNDLKKPSTLISPIHILMQF